MTNLNFTLYDFFVDVIPGVIALLLILPLLPASYSFEYLLSSGVTIGILFLIVGYVVGHFIQGVASWVDSKLRLKAIDKIGIEKEVLTIQYPFEDALEELDEGSPVRSSFKGEGSVFDDDLADGEMFRMVQSYLWNNEIGRARRFQTLYTFFRSLWVLFTVSIIFYGIAAALIYLNVYVAQATVGRLLGATLILLITTVGAYLRRVRFHKEMAKSMIYDFHTHQDLN